MAGNDAFELRDYQRELLERVQKALAPNKARVMMQLPTGGGKTVIAARLLADFLVGGRKAVWLTHRRELAHQTANRLTEAFGVLADSSREDWPAGANLPAPAISNGVKILMAQTVGLRLDKVDVWSRFDSEDLMVIDEAHHATAKRWELAMRRWPGRILGMTATPWRLSFREGFDHLFDTLVCGPQVPELQLKGSLCASKVLVPSTKQRIVGGIVGSKGDYTEGGIESANYGHNDVMTAGAVEFWQQHASTRQTIVYAVSKRHARNLVSIINDNGYSAELILGDTPVEKRRQAIADFDNGKLQVLVNVAVATEGFDLPDASCVVTARPTKSIALYLQMVGRGLRPKSDGGDCLILDLSGNSLEHGLPEKLRSWTLVPRSRDREVGEAPVVVCEQCDAASPAASHNCQSCGASLGKECGRCGRWRAWPRWRWEKSCNFNHDTVCDLCHNDAHIQQHLPILDMEESLASDIEKITSRVVAVRREFEEKVRDNKTKTNRLDQSEFDAYHRLREELALFGATVGETEARAHANKELLDHFRRDFAETDESLKFLADWDKEFPDDPLARIVFDVDYAEKDTEVTLMTKSGRILDKESKRQVEESLKRRRVSENNEGL